MGWMLDGEIHSYKKNNPDGNYTGLDTVRLKIRSLSPKAIRAHSSHTFLKAQGDLGVLYSEEVGILSASRFYCWNALPMSMHAHNFAAINIQDPAWLPVLLTES